MPVGDLGPVVDGGAAERVGADPDAGLLDRVEVDDRGQVVDVGAQEVVGARGRAGLGERRPAYAVQPGRDQLVGAGGDHRGGVGVGGAAVRRVVLEAAVARRVVRRRDHDAVGQPRS